jgi:hypothetical protein
VFLFNTKVNFFFKKGNYDYQNFQHPFSNRNTNNSLNWNSFLNNKQTFTPDLSSSSSSLYYQSSDQNGLNNENLNLIRNIENLKRLWQTNNISEGEDNCCNNLVETIEYQYPSSINHLQNTISINQQPPGNSMRTFADVAKTATIITPSQSIIPSSSSCTSSSSSSSASPPIFKLTNQNQKLEIKKSNNYVKQVQNVARPTISSCKSSNSVFSSGSLDSIEDSTEKVIKYSYQKKKLVKKSISDNTAQITKAKELKRQEQIRSTTSVSSDDEKSDSSFKEIIELEISIRDIKPDSKYGLDSFDKPNFLIESKLKHKFMNFYHHFLNIIF